jgi:hypothetical protein
MAAYGCMKVGNGVLSADFSHFGAGDFPCKTPVKKI